ncbi:MAG: hypothetical protein ACYSYU_10960, partial [Planctomycetota bacterium]
YVEWTVGSGYTVVAIRGKTSCVRPALRRVSNRTRSRARTIEEVARLIHYRISKHGKSWSVQLDQTALISGFPDSREAAVWVLEYQLRLITLAMKQTSKEKRIEEKRKILGAALLSIPEQKQ